MKKHLILISLALAATTSFAQSKIDAQSRMALTQLTATAAQNDRNNAPESPTAEQQTVEVMVRMEPGHSPEEISIDGEEVPFTKTEFELLRLLLEEKGRVFSRQELIERVWPKDVLVLDRTVDVNITRLRKKIGRFAKCIVTRLGFGYYFDA